MDNKQEVEEKPKEEAVLISEAFSANSLEDAIEAPLRWLRENEEKREHIAIVSYPRSGNSLMRGLLEKITGIYTGCDTQPDKSLSKKLQEYGLKGEGVVDDSVWFVKSHYPERSGYKPFKAKKAIVVVRNPWDAIDSYFNMMLTNTHNVSLAESQYARFNTRWDKMVRNEIEVWMKFHRFWTNNQPIPIIMVRYEDLLIHREETLRRVFLFITGKKSLEGTEWPDRIAAVVNTGGENSGPYKPRSGKIGASFPHYSQAQFDYILNTAKLPLVGFGYDPISQNFPEKIPMPRRQVKPGMSDDAEIELSGDDYQIRKENDSFGRLFTYYRKSLTEPVIAKDGSELNMHEVVEARRRKVEREKRESF